MESTVIKALIDTQNIDLFSHFIPKIMYPFILGIDISKLTLDAVLMIDGNKESATHTQLNNNAKDITKFFKSLSKVPNFSLDKCLICIEATGTHSRAFICIHF